VQAVSTRKSRTPPQTPPSGLADADMREIAVETILEGRREIALLHNGLRYRLRVTSNNKLILTK
jgi:hemin uptake protein HemP